MEIFGAKATVPEKNGHGRKERTAYAKRDPTEATANGIAQPLG